MLLIVSETRLTGHRGNAAEAAMRCKLRVRNEYGQLIPTALGTDRCP
jgi:hypothetical protein